MRISHRSKSSILERPKNTITSTNRTVFSIGSFLLKFCIDRNVPVVRCVCSSVYSHKLTHVFYIWSRDQIMAKGIRDCYFHIMIFHNFKNHFENCVKAISNIENIKCETNSWIRKKWIEIIARIETGTEIADETRIKWEWNSTKTIWIRSIICSHR